MQEMLRGLSPQPTPSLTCTTSLAPAASPPVSRGWQLPPPRHGMNVRPSSRMIPVRRPTCLPLPEKGSEQHLALVFPSLFVRSPPTLRLSLSGL
uniref:Uncharacterized protein n=1 Tax=Ursus americanus TaxID=9643 RepID=A0A452SLE0_URSAM